MDLYWRDSLTCPTEQEYIEMVNNKTGGLLRLAVKLMQACSSTNMSFQFSTILMVVITFLL
jgi:geranylgeranyl diphosphate synthase, type III